MKKLQTIIIVLISSSTILLSSPCFSLPKNGFYGRSSASEYTENTSKSNESPKSNQTNSIKEIENKINTDQKVVYFKFSDEFLKDLKKQGLDEKAIEALSSFKDKSFYSKSEIEDNLNRLNFSQKQKELIIKYIEKIVQSSNFGARQKNFAFDSNRIMGIYFYNQEEYDLAIAKFRAALSIKPNDKVILKWIEAAENMKLKQIYTKIIEERSGKKSK